MCHTLVITSSIVLLLSVHPLESLANPDPTPDPTADVFFVRQNCGPAGSEMQNCFESMTALTQRTTGWMWTVRNPSASDKVLVDVGPGQFEAFECQGTTRGWVTLRGAGREATILRGVPSLVGDGPALLKAEDA